MYGLNYCFIFISTLLYFSFKDLICPTCNSGFIEEVIEKYEEQETNSPPYSEHMDWINARVCLCYIYKYI